jgi:hypothetical protein
MRLDQPVERLVSRISRLGRAACVAEIRRIDRPRLDFTDDFLQRQPLDRLRHILVAAILQNRKTLDRSESRSCPDRVSSPRTRS